MKLCYYCKNELLLDSPPGRRNECPTCGSDLHVCLNCTFYEPGAHNECREPMAEYVGVKDRANFCDMFRFRDTSENRGGAGAKKKALEGLEKLFKK